jgi:ADP-ribose pyrophosphatase YjhB (NUDIX family)
MQLMDTDIRHFPESQRAGLCALTSMATTSPMAAVFVQEPEVPAMEAVRKVQVPPRETGQEMVQETDQETDTTIVPVPVPTPVRTPAAPGARATGLHASSRRRRPERRAERRPERRAERGTMRSGSPGGPRIKPSSPDRPRAEDEADFLSAFPPVRVGTGVLLRDDWGCVLLVKPSHRSRWAIPGGEVDLEEAPRQAVRRQLFEVLGLDREPGALLCVDVVPAREPFPRPEILYLFDGGVLGDAEQETIWHPGGQRHDWRFVQPADLEGFILGLLLRRVRAGLAAYGAGHTVNLEDGYARANGVPSRDEAPAAWPPGPAPAPASR